MSEASWLTSTKPYTLLGYIPRADRRKRRLFACACSRRVAQFMPDVRSIHCVDEVERLADGLVSLTEVRQAAREADAATEPPVPTELDGSLGGGVGRVSPQ